MTPLDVVENFELAKEQFFTLAMTCKTTKYSKHTFTLIRQEDYSFLSGFRPTEILGVGRQVLEVGDQSVVRLDFGEKIKSLRFSIYTEVNRTAEGFAAEKADLEGIELSKVTGVLFENFYTIITYEGDAATAYPVGGHDSLTTIAVPGENITAVEFISSRAGKLLIDDIRWQRMD